jgi:hypothetical protein
LHCGPGALGCFILISFLCIEKKDGSAKDVIGLPFEEWWHAGRKNCERKNNSTARLLKLGSEEIIIGCHTIFFEYT